MQRFFLTIVLSCLLVQYTHANTLSDKDIPDVLKPWIKWVLFDENKRDCPFLYNSYHQQNCSWPSRLELTLNDKKGKFYQSWIIYNQGWVAIPGDQKRWPQNININGRPAVVTNRGNRPYIFLESGNHKIKGEFIWEKIPEQLTIAPQTGLIKLVIKGRQIHQPNLRSGQLWLRNQDIGQADRSTKSDNLEIKVFRKISDEIPLKITTRIDLNVSGAHREVLLGKALLDGYIPLFLNSPLPARIEANGRLRVQIRPGHWLITLTSRYPGQVSNISLTRSVQPWPLNEIWVFAARHHLRQVEIQNVSTIDPRQTRLPEAWMKFPAYAMKADSKIIFKTIRRGDPDPEPDKLSLTRDMWLDFSGNGYTFKDVIHGKMTRGWRIEAQADLQLGRVTVDGNAQFITQLPNSNNKGVEVRHGNINLVADSRYTAGISNLPASGWQQDFQSVKTTLHLPPGWKIFSAFGVDNRPDTWLQRWTLLDLFLVLVIAVAVWRLWGKYWGLLALLTLAMIWHQPSAPQFVWLNIVAAVALLRVLPKSKFKSVIEAYRYISLAFLILISIPFLVQEIRSGLYPVLELPNQPMVATYGNNKIHRLEPEMSLARAAKATNKDYRAKKSRAKLAEIYTSSAAEPYNLYQQQQLAQFDPKANIQTGPGLPEWNWRSVYLSWNGSVQKDQKMLLVLVSPNFNILLQLLHVIFLSILLLLMTGLNYKKQTGFRFKFGNIAVLLLLVMGLSLHPEKQAIAESIPSPELLKQLKQRLLVKPDCLPECAVIPRMKLSINNNKLILRLEVHANENIALPLPAHVRNWLPTEVSVDGNRAKALLRTSNDELHIRLSKGKHQIILAGTLANTNNIQLPLPVKPKRIDVNSDGWTVDGVHDNGVPDSQLQLSRQQPRASQLQMESLEPNALPPFVKITRILRIGLDWSMETTIERLSSSDNAVVFELPLLKGESVTTDDIRVVKNHVQVNLPVRVQSVKWLSVLEKQVQLVLEASKTTQWVEIWRADISPIWHAKASGIPVIQHYSSQNLWFPTWHPWPGEKLLIEMVRPKGINGKTITISKSQLTVTPGSRSENVSLDLTLRSSQGGQHTILLPHNAKLQSVTINNAQKPIRQNDRAVTLPISPGKQKIKLNWRTKREFNSLLRSPEVNIGIDNVNHSLRIKPGSNRWILFTGGPRLGPAVLFWGELILIFFISIGLGKIKSTPLRFHHWFLLSIGLTQIPLYMSLSIIAWILALMARNKISVNIKALNFNAIQIALGLLTFIALLCLFLAIKYGLLGHPDMQITGNGSSSYQLNWYQDRAVENLPTAWILSVPLMVYRVFMLAWALWIAFSLINWLRWGWSCYSKNGLWRTVIKPKQSTTNNQKSLPSTNNGNDHKP